MTYFQELGDPVIAGTAENLRIANLQVALNRLGAGFARSPTFGMFVIPNTPMAVDGKMGANTFAAGRAAALIEETLMTVKSGTLTQHATSQSQLASSAQVLADLFQSRADDHGFAKSTDSPRLAPPPPGGGGGGGGVSTGPIPGLPGSGLSTDVKLMLAAVGLGLLLAVTQRGSAKKGRKR